MRGAVAIFVKTPGFSTVKSRLAREWGEARAVDWYGRAATAVASVTRLAQLRHGVIAYWAVAESDGAAFGAWSGLPVIAQGKGDLGTRMARVHAELVWRHGFGLLIGADAPQIDADPLGKAAQWLVASTPRLVIGPAHDGGFWLFGGNVAPPLPLWTEVAYSAADTAQQLRRTMGDQGEWLTLPTLTDVDHMSDLGPVFSALQALPEPTPEQQALIRWMRAHGNLSP